MNHVTPQTEASELISAFARNLKDVELDHFVKDRADGPYLIFQVAKPSEHLFRTLQEAQATLPEEHPFRNRATIHKRGGSVSNPIQRGLPVFTPEIAEQTGFTS